MDTVGHEFLHPFVVGEINHHVGGPCVVCQTGIAAVLAGTVHCGGQPVSVLLQQAADLLAHAASGAVYNDVHGLLLSQTGSPSSRIRWSIP